MEKRWEKKQETYCVYEKKLRIDLLKVFDKQEKDILKEFDSSK